MVKLIEFVKWLDLAKGPGVFLKLVRCMVLNIEGFGMTIMLFVGADMARMRDIKGS